MKKLIKIAAIVIGVATMFAGCGGVDLSDPKSVAEQGWKAMLDGDAKKVGVLVGKELDYDRQLQIKQFSEVYGKGNGSSYRYGGVDYEVRGVENLENGKCRVLLDYNLKYAGANVKDIVVIVLSKTKDGKWAFRGVGSDKNAFGIQKF